VILCLKNRKRARSIHQFANQLDQFPMTVGLRQKAVWFVSIELEQFQVASWEAEPG